MDINFAKINPTQNMTILVHTRLDRKQHKNVAEKLMAYENIHAEQVGFIEDPENKTAAIRLQMMGGEFCGNATMSLAAYITWTKHLPVGSVEHIPIEVSGASEILTCEVTVMESGLKGKVKMPSPEKAEQLDLNADGTFFPAVKITFPGINHYIIEESALKHSEALVKILKHTETSDAFGLMFLNKSKNFITPLVYVKSTDSMIWERGCGSGSAATGFYLAEGKRESLPLAQPGGIITVHTAGNNIWIEGMVKIAAEGIAYID